MIETPGKFQDCPDWAEYFWDLAVSGEGDTIYRGTQPRFLVQVEPEDRILFDGLDDVHSVILEENDNGFVCCETISKTGV